MDFFIIGIITIIVLVIVGVLIYKSYYNETFISQSCETYARGICVDTGYLPNTPNYASCVQTYVNDCNQAKIVQPLQPTQYLSP